MVKAQFVINYEDKSPESFNVLFNPSQFVISKSAKYTEDDSVDTKATSIGSEGNQKNGSHTKNYIGTSDASLSLELFLDTTVPEYFGETNNQKAEDVSVRVNQLMDMCVATDGEHKPPKVQFNWGSTHFSGYVHSVSATYLMFDSQGKPVRARVSLTISEAEKPEMKSANANSSPDRTKARTIKDDVDVFNIAYKEYDDPGMWKEICRANQIANPLDIPAGSVLRVPALD